MKYVYSDELMHYGVLGMKWGVRKAQDASSGSSKPKRGSEEYYRDKSNRAIARIGTSKTRLGKNISNYSAYSNAVKANNKANAAASKQEKSFLKKIDRQYGHGSNAAIQNAHADYYSRKAEYSKTRLGKTVNSAKAFNERSAAKANEKLHNSSSVEEYGKNYVDAMLNRKMKTWSGRTTTAGKQIVDQMLSAGMLGTVQDIKYYHKNSK